MGPKMTKVEMQHAKAMRHALRDLKHNPDDPEIRAKSKSILKAARAGLEGFWARQKVIDSRRTR